MTTIVRWNPLREMVAMQSALDRVFDETWRGIRNGGDVGTLALDVHETDSAYVVSAIVPGVSADAINISLHDGVMTIAGEIPQATSETTENRRAILLERTYGKFQRSIRLPQPVDTNRIEAVVENGVLTLTLPKTPEAQPRVIPVKTSYSNN
jgi:HSP20 family protein